MHFRRRPPSSAAYDYGPPRPKGDDAGALSPALRGRGAPSGSQNPTSQDPTWGQPVSMPSDVRFTRTPDRIRKERRRQAAARFPADEADPVVEPVRASRISEPPPLPRPPIAVRRSAPAPEPQRIPSAPRRAPRQIFGHSGEAVSRDRDQAPKNAPEPDFTAPAAAQAPSQTSSQAPVAREAVRTPAISTAHGFAAFDLPAVRHSYSFLWQPGTYVIDPTLKAASPAPARK